MVLLRRVCGDPLSGGSSEVIVDCSGTTQGKWDFQVACQSGHIFLTIGL